MNHRPYIACLKALIGHSRRQNDSFVFFDHRVHSLFNRIRCY
jgi:hypothetical protein